MNETENTCEKYIAEKLAPLMPMFAKASLGDFSSIVEIPENDGHFTELYIGIQVMLEVIRDQLGQLYDFNKSLEEKVTERTTELEEAYRERQEHDRTLRNLQERFAFMAAHELRMPVADIGIGFSFLLEDAEVLQQLSPKYQQVLKRLQIKNNSLLELLHDLSDIARLKEGGESYALVKIPLDAIFSEVEKGITVLARQQDITVTFPDGAGLPSVTANALGCKEVITNLVVNAIRYNTSKGWVKVEVDIRPAEAVIHVRDNGIGISEEDTKKLFSPFFRIKNHATKTIEGTGLGLFICKEILKRMHGIISVESKPGKGSDFSFTLPLYRAPSASD